MKDRSPRRLDPKDLIFCRDIAALLDRTESGGGNSIRALCTEIERLWADIGALKDMEPGNAE